MVREMVIHSSGRFDRGQAALKASVLALRNQGSLITHTELSRIPTSFFNIPGQPNWTGIRLTGSGISEYVIEYDRGVYTLLGKPTAHRLSLMFYITKGGNKKAPFYTIRAPFIHIQTGQKFFVLVTHSPLDNTKRRARVWISCAKGWVKLVNRLRTKHPEYKIIGLGDWNKNFRDSGERAKIEVHMARPAGLKQSWVNQTKDDRGGSHGKRQLIDGALTNMKVLDCDLLKDDASSDHRPVGITLDFQRPAHSTPRPKVVYDPKKWRQYGSPVKHPFANRSDRWKNQNPALWNRILMFRKAWKAKNG